MQPIDTFAVRAGTAQVRLPSRLRIALCLILAPLAGLALVAAAFLTHSQTKRVWDVSDPAHTQGTFQPGLSSQTPPQYWPLASANAASTGAPPC